MTHITNMGEVGLSRPYRNLWFGACGVLLVLALAGWVNGQQRLVAIGGGKRPPEAMKQFVDWAGGSKGRVLVVTWATASPDASYQGLKRELDSYGIASDHAPTPPLDAEKRRLLIDQLRRATGVFFGGGDQNRIMDVLADRELLNLFRKKYAEGAVFGGTSAGAAVLSDPMMTGEADLKILDGAKVGVRTGLGLVPNVIFDQHFLVRQRHNRLFGLVQKQSSMLGIGIDEDNAVLIEDNRRLRAVGTTWVMLVDGARKDGAYLVNFLRPGAAFDLKKRKTTR